MTDETSRTLIPISELDESVIHEWCDASWGLYGRGTPDNQRGYFYLGIAKSGVRSSYQHKFGVTTNPDSRLKRYRENGVEFEYTYLWNIKRQKLLEKFIKHEFYNSGRHSFYPFDEYARYWNDNGQLGWGMSEWMNLPEDKFDEFACLIEGWILGNVFRVNGMKRFHYVHFIPSKTTLYFHEPSE